VSDPTTVLLVVVGAIVLAGVVVGALVVLGAIIVSARSGRNESGLGSDEEFARELLGYQASHYPMQRQAWRNGGTDRPEEPAA
jgi:hypothetical protein